MATEEDPHAALFKDTQPAWNNLNLREICLATRSHCVMAHVRAASAGTGVSQQNCHPFKAGRLLFCHNGRIETFAKIRRAMLAELDDEAFLSVRGTTDSECIFALILTFLHQNNSSPLTQTTPFGHKRLVAAIKKALLTIEKLMMDAEIYDSTFSTFNFSLTDGKTMVVTRFCDKSPTIPPPSLYYTFGNAQRIYEELTSEEKLEANALISKETSSIASGDEEESESYYFDERPISLEQAESRPGRVFADVDPTAACFIVASNPLTRTSTTWHPLPRNSIMWYTQGSLPELRVLHRAGSTRKMKHDP